ncbi:MAG: hypothetical protein NT159_19400 [Proteobacteria bacterium]|nr:hypothetical protein [Pseudomonadota bacterium]
MTAMLPQWQIERGQLNHNWLQNGVLVALNHALSISFGMVRPGDIPRTLTEDVGRWPERRAELSLLLDRFEDEMSPKIHFAYPPLSHCPAETLDWLKPLVHELWLQRWGILEKIDAAKDAYRAADRAFLPVVSALSNLPRTPAPDDLRLVSLLLQTFIEQCQALADSISALPQRVLCC